MPELILKYNPDWNGCNDYRHYVWVPQMMLKEAHETFNILHYVSYAELKVKT